MLSSKVGKTTKVIVCGMKGVGKTTVLEQLIYGNVDDKTEIHPTIEDIYVANIETDRGTKEKVRFYDTAGIDFSQKSTANGSTTQQLPRQYLGFADGYVLIYDTEKSQSLDVLLSLKKDIDKNKDKKEITLIVVGNQTVMKEGHAAPTDVETTISKASAWCAREKLRHFIVNSYVRNSLYEAFVHLASKLNPPPSKSSFPQLSMGRKAFKSENS